MKIFGFFNSMEESGDAVGIAISEDGEIITSHISSSESFSKHDLGMNDKCTWKHEIYDEKFPDGWEVEFVKIGDRDAHDGLQEAFRKHDPSL